MATTDRLSGVETGVAVKAPCRVATTANITALSGLLTIDGVTLEAGDRVLVKNQSTASQNGIYDASLGVWSRARDFDTSGEIAQGTQVFIAQGSANAGKTFRIATGSPVIGASLAFVESSLGVLTSSDITDSTTAGRALLTGANAAAQRSSLGLGSLATASAVASTGISDSTEIGRSVLTAADAAAARTALGIGTGGTTVASTEITDSTAAGRALLTAANAAAQRTSLGLGSLATKSTAALSDMAALTGNSKIVGSSSSSSAVAELTLGTGLSLVGSTLSATGSASTSFGEIGTYVLAVYIPFATLAQGASAAGSVLRSTNGTGMRGVTLSGTWRNMGYDVFGNDPGTDPNPGGTSLFVRVA